MASSDWQPISLALLGPLDTRSRPADLAPGSFRFKQNLSVSKSGKLGRRPGYGALNFGPIEGTAIPNYDHHRQSAEPREWFNLIFESTSAEGVRSLFDGTQTKLAVLDNLAGEWATIGTVPEPTAATVWRAAELENRVYFTDNANPPLVHVLGSGTTAPVTELISLGAGFPGLTKARLVFQFGGVILWMNTYERGKRYATRVRWSNHRKGEKYDPAEADTVTGYFDLDYGHDILNAVEMAGALWIFTAKSIWRCTIQVSDDSIFSFVKLPSDPKSQSGMLVYPNSLVTDGDSMYWLSRESAYQWNPQMRAPKCTDEYDWLLKSTGLLYEGDERIDPECCESVIGQYWPDRSEIYFFYPRINREGADCINDAGIVLNTQFRTADHLDFGMTALGQFSRAIVADTCKAVPVLIGASSQDWALKNIGSVFAREELVVDDPEDNIPDGVYELQSLGYYSILRGQIPTGFPNIEKTVRSLLLEHDTRDSATQVVLKIGNSAVIQDANSVGPKCAVQWTHIKPISPDGKQSDGLPLACTDEQSIASMTAKGLRPSNDTCWAFYAEGRVLYFEIMISGPGMEAPTGGDSVWNKLVFEVLA